MLHAIWKAGHALGLLRSTSVRVTIFSKSPGLGIEPTLINFVITLK